MNKWWDKAISDTRPSDDVSFDDMFGQTTKWTEEWIAARDKAASEIEPQPRFQIWQSPEDGWWRVGEWRVVTVPGTVPQMWHLTLLRPLKPSMVVFAFGKHEPFGPTHKTERVARKWLADLLKPPPVKRAYFDSDGNEVEP